MTGDRVLRILELLAAGGDDGATSRAWCEV